MPSVNLLLDTSVALGAVTDSPRLPATARETSLWPKTTVWASAASRWQIAIPHGLGRGDMPVPAQDALGDFPQAGHRLLPIELEPAAAVQALPAYHADPFDRILVTQALVELMRLRTHDPQVARDSDTVMAV